MKKQRIGVIFGGRSVEHQVSITSARSIVEAMDKAKYLVVPLGINRKGEWLSERKSWHLLSQGESPLIATPPRTLPPWTVLRKLDVAFPVLHGTYGEDGTVQGLLELAGIPYVGSGVLASAIGMDKAMMKAVFRHHGLPVPDFQVMMRAQWESQREQALTQLESQFSYPCFVKPANSGSSIGISKAHSRFELAQALDEAARLDRKIVVEEAIDGREIECSILGNNEPVASVLGEIISAREFYDYEAKYHDNNTQLFIPAQLSSELTAEIQCLAVKAFLAIDGAGMGRVDFLVDKKSQRIHLSEINTIPGFTPISMYPKLWEASGISYSQLIDRLIKLAMGRHKEKPCASVSPNY
ncbi:MAG: D-alanine--D-alanine ligase [Chloroflexi bacterium]|nr:D-alanine--D-alanine ligase [Chloroflexota bacterium]